MASTRRFVRAMCVGGVLGLSIPAAAQTPAPAAQAQEVREELDKLRKEFETVRDTYGARLAALEAKLTAMGAPSAPALPGQPAAAPAQAAAVSADVQVPPGAAGGGGPTGTLPVYGRRQRGAELSAALRLRRQPARRGD